MQLYDWKSWVLRARRDDVGVAAALRVRDSRSTCLSRLRSTITFGIWSVQVTGIFSTSIHFSFLRRYCVQALLSSQARHYSFKDYSAQSIQSPGDSHDSIV